MSKPSKRLSVVVKHVGKEDIEHHINILGVKNQRKTRSSCGGIAAEFFNDVPEIRKKTSETTKSVENKAQTIDNTEKDILDEIKSMVPAALFENNAQFAGVDVFGFKTPKRAKQMSKLATESAMKIRRVKKITTKENENPILEEKTHNTPKKKATNKSVEKEIVSCDVGKPPKTPGKKSSLNESENTTKTPRKEAENDPSKSKTPGKKSSATPKTPSRTSNRTKKYLVQEMRANQQADEESESSGSEESEEEEEEERNSASGTTSTMAQSSKRIELPSETELYFEAHKTGRKLGASTSDRTLARLKIPQMNQERMQTILEELQENRTSQTKNSSKFQACNDASKIEISRQGLLREYKHYFQKWMFYFGNDYNILLYGLGSKRKLVHDFCEKMLSEYDKIVINGYFPSLIIKSILTSISELSNESVIAGGNQQQAQVDAICRKYSDDGDFDDHLFLIVHNIDGTTLRNTKAQNVLSCLAACPRIHMIATVDHINASLIWDQSKLSRYKWLWYDVTTYEPYKDETSFEDSLLMLTSGTGIGGSLALSGLVHVARSLTPNARGIFKLLAEFQIEESKTSNYIGLSFSDLYQMCREKFLVNSELTLRTQLTEFLDHKLVEIKKGIDGGECLSIPLDNSTLQEYLDQAQ